MIDDKTLQRLKGLIDQDDVATLGSELAERDADDLTTSLLYGDFTILMYACRHGSAEAVRAFLERGVRFYEIKYCDNTEFKSAARNPRHARKILELLVAALDGRDPDDWIGTDGDPWGDMDGQGDGLTALDILRSRGDTPAFDYLSEVLRQADSPPQPAVREPLPAATDSLPESSWPALVAWLRPGP